MRTKLLGDPHLGRQFIHGVPLHNRGKREIMVWNQFSDEVSKCKDVDLHICMGDLFDKAVVPYRVIERAAIVYASAAQYWPKVKFVILKGNHDWLRDLSQPSAFDIFARIVEPQKNIIVVDTPTMIEDKLFVPWHPTGVTIGEVNGIKTAYGHWDLESYGGEDTNLIPTKLLAELGVTDAYNGHIHRPQELSRDGVKVHVVGSMQPYAHGEEVDERLYVTRRATALGDLGTYRDKCLRVICEPDDTVDQQYDCLQLVIKKEISKQEDEPTVTLGDFDVESLFLQALADGKVSTQTSGKLHEFFLNKRLSDTS